MKKAILKHSIMTVLCLIFTVGCSSTKLSTVWNDPNYRGEAVSNIMIISVTENIHNRHLYEDSFVKQLQRDGIKAVASHTLIKNLDTVNGRDEIRAIVKQQQVDSVLVTTLESVEAEEKFVATPPSYKPLHGGEESFYNYLGNTMAPGGYAVTETTVKLKTSLFSVKSEKMIWQGHTHSFNPRSAKNVVDENIQLTIEYLKQSDLL